MPFLKYKRHMLSEGNSIRRKSTTKEFCSLGTTARIPHIASIYPLSSHCIWKKETRHCIDKAQDKLKDDQITPITLPNNQIHWIFILQLRFRGARQLAQGQRINCKAKESSARSFDFGVMYISTHDTAKETDLELPVGILILNYCSVMCSSISSSWELSAVF